MSNLLEMYRIWEWSLLFTYITCALNLFFQLEEKYLVEIFCEMNMDEFEAAVGESFTNLAFEAMEKIINVSPGNLFL